MLRLFSPLFLLISVAGLALVPPVSARTSTAAIAPGHAPRQQLAWKTGAQAAIALCPTPSHTQQEHIPSTQKNTAVLAQQISARSAIVIDAKDGRPLFSKMADNLRQPASTIKIVTAMIALEALSLDEQVTVSWNAVIKDGSKVYLKPGTHYSTDDLINAVLLSSANDAAVALAEKIGGTEEKFAHLMNLTAKMWGAKNTLCKTASGLTAEGQYTTARDLATLMRYAMQQKSFAARMHQKYVQAGFGQRLRNHNRALWRIKGADGGKTGYTVAARQTYVGQFSREGRSIIVAIMGSETMWADLAKLVSYGFADT